MGRGKFKGKPTGQRHFSTPEEMAAGISSKPRSFKRNPEHSEEAHSEDEDDDCEEEEEVAESVQKKNKGTQGVITIDNPNLNRAVKSSRDDADMERVVPVELSRREREELQKQKAYERYMRLQEQGKTEQAKKDLERLALIKQQRLEAARKREEEKAAKEAKKLEAARKREEEKAAKEAKKLKARKKVPKYLVCSKVVLHDTLSVMSV